MKTYTSIAVLVAGLRRALPAVGFSSHAVRIVFVPDAPKPVPVAVTRPPVGNAPHSR